MRLGVIMLLHDAFQRAEQVARHWLKSGCPVVVHIDTSADQEKVDAFCAAFADEPNVRFGKRFRCEWGTWGLVEATLNASEELLTHFPEVERVLLTSGACLPLRPVSELANFLAARPGIDFIESVTVKEVPWITGGLSSERFTLWFPVAWKRSKWLFDTLVGLQRRLGIRRRIPKPLSPHLGSQWWCLTRETLRGILDDPERDTYEAFFRLSWIPDESYFQTMARKHSSSIESRSLTLSRFDPTGKPYVFYDDHVELLMQSDCFIARKIWYGADRLYNNFLTDAAGAPSPSEPNPGRVARVFLDAEHRSSHGRKGLFMQSSFNRAAWKSAETAAPYSVFQGVSDVIPNFTGWLSDLTSGPVHGNLFARDRVHYAENERTAPGALGDSSRLRDYNPRSFLTSLIWNTRGQRLCFEFSPSDRQGILRFIAKDPNAHVTIITGAWVIPIYESDVSEDIKREEMARLQAIEVDAVQTLRSSEAKAQLRILTLAEFLEAPTQTLREIGREIDTEAMIAPPPYPAVRDLSGLARFLQETKNGGTDIYLTGHFTTDIVRSQFGEASDD